MKLSALVLVRNEEKIIGECLNQLTFADEIIVLDQASTDKTVEIAKKYTNKISPTKNQSFDKNRNQLAHQAQGEWLLYLDADERLSTEGIEEIQKTIAKGQDAAYYLPRKNIILGRWLKHGGWWPDYVPRLFRKSALVLWQGAVHESPKVEGQFGYLTHPIVHHTARDISQMFQKSVKWAKIEARLYHQAHHKKVTIPIIVKAMAQEFISRYFLKLGFLDGGVGLIESLYQAYHQAMVLTYLWEMQNE